MISQPIRLASRWQARQRGATRGPKEGESGAIDMRGVSRTAARASLPIAQYKWPRGNSNAQKVVWLTGRDADSNCVPALTPGCE